MYRMLREKFTTQCLSIQICSTETTPNPNPNANTNPNPYPNPTIWWCIVPDLNIINIHFTSHNDVNSTFCKHEELNSVLEVQIFQDELG